MSLVRLFLFSTACAATVSCGVTAFGQGPPLPGPDCYFDRVNVGCDPEGYGYESVNCPANCDAQDVANTQGCTNSLGTIQWWSQKHAFFDSMTMRIRDDGMPPKQDGDGPSFHEDLAQNWGFNVCLREGQCKCKELENPHGGNSGYMCESFEEWVWEEWFPPLTNQECIVQVAGDPCDCQGDPYCEWYCNYYGGGGS
jgi:hypothetical protein